MSGQRRRSRIRRALAVALTVAVTVTLAACSPTFDRRFDQDLFELWTEPAFYKQPKPLPAGKPGDLIRVEPVFGAPDGAVAWRVLFHSTDVHGDPVVNSGLVVAPDSPAPAGGRTIVSWGHPTTGAAQRCAPSAGLDPFDLIEGLTDLLHRGYVVTYTDYTGMGTAGPNSYLVGDTEGKNVLDAARAARAITKSGASDRLVLWGHSQGGQAALFAAQLAPTYAPELKLKAVAVAAPATNLAQLMNADIGDISGVTISSYAFTAYESVYGPTTPGATLDSILTPAAVAALPAMAKLCLIGQNNELHSIGKPLIGSFLTGDPATQEPWATLLDENTPGSTKLTAPLFVAQGDDDQLVRPSSTADFVAHERSIGSTVVYQTIEKTGHGLVALRAMPELLKWLPSVGAGATAAPPAG